MGGTDLHREPVRVRNTRLFPFWEYDSSVAYFPPCPDKAESKQRAKRPPGHSGLKFWLVTTLRRARSLWSLRQALRLTPPAKISPFGHRPPFKWAGSCTSAFLCGFIGGGCIWAGRTFPHSAPPLLVNGFLVVRTLHKEAESGTRAYLCRALCAHVNAMLFSFEISAREDFLRPAERCAVENFSAGSGRPGV